MSSIYQTFTEKIGVCEQYSGLLHDMLSVAGIVSFQVSGFNIGYPKTIEELTDYEVGREDGRAWVIANVDGEWRFYDCITGSPDGITLSALLELVQDGVYTHFHF